MINMIHVACLQQKQSRKLHSIDNSDPSERESQPNTFWKGSTISGAAKIPMMDGKRSREFGFQRKKWIQRGGSRMRTRFSELQ